MPGGSERISPIRTASAPRGCARRAARAASASFGADHRHELSLVGHVERVDAEQFAGGRHGGTDGKGGLVQHDGQVAVPGQFVADRAHPAPGGVAQPTGGRGGGQQALHQVVEWCRVRDDVGFQGQVAPGQHDGRAVVADRARREHHVAVAHPLRRELAAGRDQTRRRRWRCTCRPPRRGRRPWCRRSRSTPRRRPPPRPCRPRSLGGRRWGSPLRARRRPRGPAGGRPSWPGR